MILDWIFRNLSWLLALFIAIGAAISMMGFRRDLIRKWVDNLINTVIVNSVSNLGNGALAGIGAARGGAVSSSGLLAAITKYIVQSIRTAVESPKFEKVLKVVLRIVIAILIILPVFFGLRWAFDRSTLINTLGLQFPTASCQRENYSHLLIFIHGWTGDRQETWEKFPELICQDRRFDKYEVFSIHYPTAMERAPRIYTIADWISGELDTGMASSIANIPISIMAHSMGGLIAREFVILRKLAEHPSTLKRIVEIGTPHQGANGAKIASIIGISSDLTADLSKDSSYLRGMQVQWNSLKNRPETHCFSSPNDSVVDQDSAFFQCDKTFSYPQWGHTELVKPLNHKDTRYVHPTRRILDDSSY